MDNDTNRKTKQFTVVCNLSSIVDIWKVISNIETRIPGVV
jgi:hypothetical protein